MGFFESFANLFGSQSSESSFDNRMLSLGREVGLEVLLDDDGDAIAGLIVPVQGQSYTLVVAKNGSNAVLSAVSNVKFPPGRLPREIMVFLANKNREMECGQFDTVDAPRHSYFVIRAVVRWNRLTANLINGAVREMIGRIVALDTTMLSERYVQ